MMVWSLGGANLVAHEQAGLLALSLMNQADLEKLNKTAHVNLLSLHRRKATVLPLFWHAFEPGDGIMLL
jgi:NADP-dependent 3-hydroxy acid dehydrogenase YdfG